MHPDACPPRQPVTTLLQCSISRGGWPELGGLPQFGERGDGLGEGFAGGGSISVVFRVVARDLCAASAPGSPASDLPRPPAQPPSEALSQVGAPWAAVT